MTLFTVDGKLLVVDGKLAASVNCCCDGEFNPVCTSLYDNLTDTTMFLAPVSGLSDNVACISCATLNTTFGLVYEGGCCWVHQTAFCVAGGGGSVTVRFCGWNETISGPSLEIRVERVLTPDGDPIPAEVQGGVSAFYGAADPGLTFPASITMNLLSSDTVANNGPCSFSPPATIIVTRM